MSVPVQLPLDAVGFRPTTWWRIVAASWSRQDLQRPRGLARFAKRGIDVVDAVGQMLVGAMRITADRRGWVAVSAWRYSPVQRFRLLGLVAVTLSAVVLLVRHAARPGGVLAGWGAVVVLVAVAAIFVLEAVWLVRRRRVRPPRRSSSMVTVGSLRTARPAPAAVREIFVCMAAWADEHQLTLRIMAVPRLAARYAALADFEPVGEDVGPFSGRLVVLTRAPAC